LDYIKDQITVCEVSKKCFLFFFVLFINSWSDFNY
jgi:hypothetical protein